MPCFDFIHEKSGHVISVLVTLSEPIKSFHEQIVTNEETGEIRVYKRVYAAPLAAKDTKRKQGSKDDYKRVTGDKKLTVGEMWEISKEMSQERADKNGGTDPVNEQFYKDYEKKMGGKHIDVKKREAMEKAKKVFEANGIRVD